MGEESDMKALATTLVCSLLMGCDNIPNTASPALPYVSVSIAGLDAGGDILLALRLTNVTSRTVTVQFPSLPDTAMAIALVEVPKNTLVPPAVVPQDPAVLGMIRDHPIGEISLKPRGTWTNDVSMRLFYGNGWETRLRDNDSELYLLWSYQLVTSDGTVFDRVTSSARIPRRPISGKVNGKQ